MSNPIITFKVDDGLNTSYIDSLLVALFYKSSIIQNMLINIPENSAFLYLQDQIQRDFVDQIRQNYSISSSLINEIRNYSIICGWKNGFGNIVELFNVSDFYIFLATGFGMGLLNFEITPEINNNLNNINNYQNILIKFSTNQPSSIKILLDEWINNNLLKINNNKQPTQCYHFKEIPLIITFNIDRSNETKYVSIDIMKKIQFCKNNNEHQNNLSWVIHSIVCLENSRKSSYYSIIKYDENNWYLFDNNKIPSLNKIDIKNDLVLQNKIKNESVLIIYKLDDMIGFD
jgi:hypothetical protein